MVLGPEVSKSVERAYDYSCATETICSASAVTCTSGLIIMRAERALLEAHVSDKYKTLSARSQFGNDRFDDIRPAMGWRRSMKGTAGS